MTKTAVKKRPAEKPETKVISMARLMRERRAARQEGLHLKIFLPPEVLPLFKAGAEIMGLDAEAFAVFAICKGMTSEDVMNAFDDLVNRHL